MTDISVTSILLFGELNPPLLTFARSCKKQGIRTFLIDVKPGKKLFGSYSSAISGSFLFPGEYLYDSKGIQWINQIARQVDAQAIAAVSDSLNLWLSRSRSNDVLEPVPLTSGPIVLENLSSKEYQNRLARKHGLTVLDSWYMTCPDDVSSIPENAYPVCIRPSDPNLIRPSFKALVCDDPIQLASIVRSRTSMEGPIIAQSYKDCPNMVLCMARDKKGKVGITASFLVEKKFQGFALKLSAFQLPEHILQKAVGLVEEIGIAGVLHFDFLYQDNELYFLEINARLGGVTDKVYKLGYDEPRYAVNSFFDTGETAGAMKFSGKYQAVVNKKAVLKYLLFSLLGKNERIDYPRLSKGKHLTGAVHDLFMVKDSMFDAADLKGYFWFYLQ